MLTKQNNLEVKYVRSVDFDTDISDRIMGY